MSDHTRGQVNGVSSESSGSRDAMRARKLRSTAGVLERMDENLQEMNKSNTIKLFEQKLSKELSAAYKREKNLRNSTVTIRKGEGMSYEDILNIIDSHYVNKLKKRLNYYWQDNENVYCQLDSSESKKHFIEFITSSGAPLEFSRKMLDHIQVKMFLPDVEMNPNESSIGRNEASRGSVSQENGSVGKAIGTNNKSQSISSSKSPIYATLREMYRRASRTDHVNARILFYCRKPVRLEIEYVKPEISVSILNDIMKRYRRQGSQISEIREGKVHNSTKARSFLFNANQEGFRVIFLELTGSIPYCDQKSGERARLRVKIDLRPRRCKDCYKMGRHSCEGKRCGNCGSLRHSLKDCTSSRKFCSNCKCPGHNATEVMKCSSYFGELLKELRRVDIPLEYYNDAMHRKILMKAIKIA